MAARRKLKIAAAVAIAVLSGCAHSKPKTTPELASMVGKRVAFAGIEGEETARNVVEVALINQLVRTGNFEILSKQTIEQVQQAPDVDPNDWKQISQRANADYYLKAKVLSFDAPIHKGYSEEQVDDSQLAVETGNGKTTRVYPVERMDGHVAVELTFVNVKPIDPKDPSNTRVALAEKSESVSADARTEAMHLPPKLRFLEKIANEAFQEFFEKYR